MDGKAEGAIESKFSWHDVRLLLGLAVVVLAMRGWQLFHTEVTARDSIGYIRIAWRLEHEGLVPTLRSSQQHPLFPAAVLVTSWLVRPWMPPEKLPEAMELSSQLVSALCSLLLVLPMYFLGRELFNRRIAFVAVLLFESLPGSGRILADGVAEALFLTLATTALLAAVVGLRRGSPWALAAAGLTAGLAYLTRPEGGLIVPAAGIALVATSLVPQWRLDPRRLLACGLSLTTAALLVAGPYMAAIGGVTVKPTAKTILHGFDRPGHGSRTPPQGMGSARNSALLAVYAPMDAGHYRWGFWALAHSLVISSFYCGWVPMLVGLWYRRELFATHPGSWVLVATVTILTAFLFKVATTMGYLSERHTLLILLLGTFWLAAGLTVLGAGMGNLVRWRWPERAASLWGNEHFWTNAMIAVALLSLWRTLAPLHWERTGFREAGEWLARHVPAGDFVDDPYCWSHYFSGRVFLEGRLDLPREEPPVHYVVYEKSGNKHERLYWRDDVELHQQGGRLVASWPVSRGRNHAEIQIYAMPGLRPPPPPVPNLPPFLAGQLGS